MYRRFSGSNLPHISSEILSPNLTIGNKGNELKISNLFWTHQRREVTRSAATLSSGERERNPESHNLEKRWLDPLTHRRTGKVILKNCWRLSAD